jgi:hypothetical protein
VYVLIGLSLGLGFYVLYLLSPFIGSFRRKLLEWDDGKFSDVTIISCYYYVEYLKSVDSDLTRFRYMSIMSDLEFIFKYLITHVLFGIAVLGVVALAWPVVLVLTAIVVTIKRVLKSIKNK